MDLNHQNKASISLKKDSDLVYLEMHLFRKQEVVHANNLLFRNI